MKKRYWVFHLNVYFCYSRLLSIFVLSITQYCVLQLTPYRHGVINLPITQK